MDLGAVLLQGFAATTILATILRAGQALGLMRMDRPLMLGVMVTPDRDRAKVYGFQIHRENGWLSAAVCAAGIEALGTAAWRLGAAIGPVESMAGDATGPEPARELESPRVHG